MKLIAINPENQLTNVLFGTSEEEKESVRLKIEYTAKNIDKVTHINGVRVFYPIVTDGDIFYSLQALPAGMESLIKNTNERKYYYPIQYAVIYFDLAKSN